MAEISALMVKDLRDKTGAGMADCKKALVEADGDITIAIEVLRKRGAASAAKRADKIANEGMIVAVSKNDNKNAVMVEVNCETDFVARNQEFDDFVSIVANALLNNNITNVDELMKVSVDGDSVEGLYNSILSKFSEKIEIRKFEHWTSEGFISTYIHAGNKLAVLLDVAITNVNDKAVASIRDIAMQIAAMNPQFIDRSQVDQTTLDKEVEIYKQQAIDSGKKPDIAEKIAQGKLDKFFTENCLIEQAFVKDGSISVNDVIKQISELTGSEVKINRFARYALGES
ncbi:MAG: elongation factor Ts [Ignavibacteriae bacterium HGW-Ignavibacteriae-1]|jgi:elongation factor Ts|nr:MAG: elongation factor Ts [Ignavibacteriae bacterium HGW-Ignavibacteriae-1]